MLNTYPALSWVRKELKLNLVYSFRRKVIAAYIVGSEAKGTTNDNSDLDVAIIIEAVRGKTALQITEEYHQKFLNDLFKPRWENRILDFQFFYPDDQDLKTYKKIPIK
ncbi:nucleotidyltransferase domain-containing protein [[Brevibacterium] frigoritolerans]|nr:nucleotidyltransferase domain-containing protein [Peribacillus frigoritolerans]